MADAVILKDIKVVDLGMGRPTAIISKFLHHLGADIVRVVPDAGDPFASHYPSHDVWHRHAEIVDSEKHDLESLLASADICIMGGEDHPEITRRTDVKDIAARHPKLIVVDINDAPEGTEFSGGPTTELIAQIRSGLAWEQVPGRPIVNAFDPSNYGAAMQGLIGILAALYEREGSGKGQLVTTSLFEGALSWIGTYWAILEKPNPMADFVIPVGVSPLIFKTRDNKFLHLVMGSAGSKYGMYQALKIDDPSVKPGDSGMPQPGGSPRNFFGDYDILTEHVVKQDRQPLLEAIWEVGLPAEPIMAPGECWSDPQIERNAIIQTDSDGTRHVALPFLRKVLSKGAPIKPAADARRPLDGLVVIDCGAFMAGPMAAVPLADLGATVIKVEAKAGDPNRSIFKSFATSNRGKKNIVLDMKDEDGKAAMQKLCAGADIVMNNFRPGVSKRLGVDPESLAKLNPKLIVLESPAFGSEGPLAQKPGFDMIMQAWCGHEEKAAGSGNEPRWNRTNLVDIVGAMLGSISMLAGLFHRARTGEALAIEVPLVNAGIFALSELVQRPDGRFEGSPTLSSSLSGYHPAECLYQTNDGWVGVVARGNKAISGLRSALQLEAKLPADAAAWTETEEKVIAEKLAMLSNEAVSALLEPAGVWVEICREGREKAILGSKKLQQHGTVRVVPHKQFGNINELAGLFTLSRSETGNERSCPILGEQTREILAALGYGDAAIDDLIEKGVAIAAE